jgi:serine/threonine protein kinase
LRAQQKNTQGQGGRKTKQQQNNMPALSLRRSFHQGRHRGRAGGSAASGGDAASAAGGGGGGPGGSLHGSAIGRGLLGGGGGAFLRSSRAFGRASYAGSVDVATRVSAYRAGFDPLALLRRLPATMAGHVVVKAGHNFSALLPSYTDHYWAELRGGVVVLMEPNDLVALSSSSSHSSTSSSSYPMQQQQKPTSACLSTTSSAPSPSPLLAAASSAPSCAKQQRASQGGSSDHDRAPAAGAAMGTRSTNDGSCQPHRSSTSHPAAGASPALSANPDSAVFYSVFSVQGTTIHRPPRSTTIRIRKRGSSQNVWLRCPSELAAAKWEQALAAAATERVACVSDFEFLAPIGKGASGKVFLVRDRQTGRKFALKVIPKSRVFETRSGFRHALDERLALQIVAGHPFFSQLRYAFQTRANFYLVIDFYQGGDLYQYLRLHGGRLAEPQVRMVAAEVLLAIEHLHKCGFVYRDLKPENVLLDAAGHVRLADFGLSKYLPPSSPLTKTICGTHTYAAPEMLAVRHYGTSIDDWALGIFIYHIFRGRTPFEAKDLDQVIQKMNAKQIRFPTSASEELVSVVKRLLDWQPASRLGCGVRGTEDIKDHPFFAAVDWSDIYRRADHPEALYNYDKTCTRRERLRKGSKGGRKSADKAVLIDASSSPVSQGSPVSTPAGGSTASSPQRGSSLSTTPSGLPEGKPNILGLSEVSEPSLADDELRNFDLAEWADVSVDQDFDDPTYGDQSFWPMKSVRKRLEDERLIVGFSYTSNS